VSPGNILIGRAGEVKLSDFGIVRSDFIDRRTSPGELKGKIGYMSPEQALGDEIDRRSDLFTVAIVLSELLLARPLFPGRSELEILSRIHDADLGVLERHAHGMRPDLYKILRRALSRRREDRFQSADALAEALRNVAASAGFPLSEGDLCGWLSSTGIMPLSSGVRPAVAAPLEPAPPAARAVPSERPTEPGQVPDMDARFRLEVPSGRELGLLGTADLLELCATGRVAPTARVLEPGRPPRPLTEVAALGALIGAGRYAFGELPDGVELERISPARLPSYLYALAARRETGLLIARDRRREKRIHLRDGAPVHVASTQREELLGQRLLAAGAITSEQLGLALSDSADGGEHLGVSLVDRGYLRPSRLIRALHAQIGARVADLGGYRELQIAFARGARAFAEAVPPSRVVAAWVTSLVRERLPERAMEAAIEAVGPAPLARHPAPLLAVDALGLDAEELAVLEALPGVLSASALSKERAGRGVRPEVVRRVVFVALSAGVLVAPGWAPGR
jgi:serine/threonine-protein kinase